MDEKQSNAGLSIFAYSFTMYFRVSLSLSKSRGGSHAGTYKLSAGEFEKLPGIAEGLGGVLHQALLNTTF